MKLALLTKYSDLAASTRQRFNQYQTFLENTGFELIKVPLFDDQYLYNLYNSNNRNLRNIAKSYIHRFRWLISKPDIDLIWLHCDLFPYMPGIFEKLVTYPGKPIVYDLDDAIFHNYDLNPRWYVRKLLGKKLFNTIKKSKISFCGNKYLANYASQLCSRVEVVPTVVDTNILKPIERIEYSDKLKIGWIGTPTTWSEYLYPILPLLKELVKKEGGQINIMGAGKNVILDPTTCSFEEWSLERELPFLQSLDIGIMPLVDSPWATGKSGYKLIQYMACGLPVVASPVGVNREIVDHGVNGYLVENQQEWRTALKKLLCDKNLRKAMGFEGRKKVEKHYSLKVWGPRVSKMLYEISNS